MNYRELRGRGCTYYRSLKKMWIKAVVIWWDLPHTCACTWCCIQTEWWKENNDSAGFKNLGALKFIQTKFYSHQETLGILGVPPGRALFNSKISWRSLPELRVEDLGVGWPLPPNTHTFMCLQFIIRGQSKIKRIQGRKVYLAYLFGRLILRLDFFNEINHIILFIIRF